MQSALALPADYPALLDTLKKRIDAAQVKAALFVNRELVLLYWDIGREILLRQATEGWGTRVTERLAADLRTAFPNMKGFSPRNLVYMQTLARVYPDVVFTQQVVAQIPWGHNLVILDKVRDPAQREWYLRHSAEYGWSRAVLVHQIEGRLFEREGQALTNFSRALPAPQSDLAQQLLKDPYTFDFLQLSKEAEERELERSLVAHIRDFLLELGVGFAFLGSQYHLEVGDQDYYIDLLFYHVRPHCYVVIELKATDFKPEFAGKLQFYLAVVDDQLRGDSDAPSVGLILCKSKNRVIVEYALKDTNRPIGVSEYQIIESLPEKLKGSLPSIEEIEAQLGAVNDTQPEDI